MSADLLPCPFCGGIDALEVKSADGRSSVICQDCYVEVAFRSGSDSPADLWNRRRPVLSDDIPADVAEAFCAGEQDVREMLDHHRSYHAMLRRILDYWRAGGA